MDNVTYRKQTGRLDRGVTSLKVRADTINDEKRTVDVVFTTGALVKRYSWALDEYYWEELGTKRSEVRLERLNSGAPVLNAHSAGSLDDVLGTVVEGSARMVKGEGMATLRFDDDRGEGENGQDGPAEKVFRKIKRKTLKSVSVGYWTHKAEEVRRADDGLRVFRATDWEPGEISPVPVPADVGARVRGAESDFVECEFKLMEKRDMKVDPKEASTPENKTGNEGARAADPVDTDAIKREATELERKRCVEIRSACESMRLDAAFMQKLISDGVSIEDARKAMIDERVRLDAEKDTRGANNIEVTRDERVTRLASVEASILNRVNPGKFQLDDAARQYRGYTMIELARDFLESHGEKTRGLSKMELAGRAFHATTDFPILLANVANKVLKAEYAEAPQTHAPLVTPISLSDFKVTDIVQMGGGDLDLEELGESGEIKYGTIGEAKEQIQLRSYAKGFSYTRKMLINDDTGVFNRIPGLFGRKVRKKEGDLVWSIFTGNPAMGDSKTLFHAGHGNLATVAAAIGETPVSVARVAMRTQTDVDGDLVQVRPRYLIVPVALETAAQKFVNAVIVATKDADTNVFKGAFEIISEARLDAASTTAWYLAGAPSEIDLIGLGYLEGEAGPVLETASEFDIEGVKMKVRADMVAKALDWRGLYKNAGA